MQKSMSLKYEPSSEPHTRLWVTRLWSVVSYLGKQSNLKVPKGICARWTVRCGPAHQTAVGDQIDSGHLICTGPGSRRAF